MLLYRITRGHTQRQSSFMARWFCYGGFTHVRGEKLADKLAVDKTKGNGGHSLTTRTPAWSTIFTTKLGWEIMKRVCNS